MASVRIKTALGLVCVLAWLLSSSPLSAAACFRVRPMIPAIKYSTAPLNNAVASLNQKLQEGAVRLAFEGRSGYLRTALAALEIPVDSQMLVFSPTSLQAPRISAANPRALFFTDRVALGWVRDGDVLEVAAQDATQGVVFYTLDQRATDVTAVQADDHLPRVSRRQPHARRPRPPDVQHEAVRHAVVRPVGHDGSSQSPERALGRLVRDRQQRFRAPTWATWSSRSMVARAGSCRRWRDCSTRTAIGRRSATSPRCWCFRIRRT